MFGFAFLASVEMVSVEVSAQTIDTPRKKIIRDLQAEMIAALEDVKVEDISVPIPQANISRAAKAALPKSIQKDGRVEDKMPSLETVVKKLVKREPALPILPRTQIKETVTPTLSLTSVPFFVTAEEYVTLRGGEKSGQLILEYDVTRYTQNNLLPRVEKVKLVLGVDYAAVSRGGVTKIYDFKLNRVLKITPQIGSDGAKTGKMIFANGSLYTRVFQNMKTVGKVTQNGTIRDISLGSTARLDAFWVESAMSWMAAQADTQLDISRQDTQLNITRKREIILAAKFADTAYETLKYRDSLLAFAHHEWPLHPHVLQALYPFTTPIKSLEFRTYGPRMPNGETQKWVLRKQTKNVAGFPLPFASLSVTELTSKPSLAGLIRNAAGSKPKSASREIESEFYAQYDKGAYYNAWRLGQKYISHIGNSHKGTCDEISDGQICGLLRDIEIKIDSHIDGHVGKKFKAITDAQNMPSQSADRLAVLQAVLPYLDDADILASTLRMVAIARAKLNDKQARDIGFGAIRADELLVRALKKFPYDPQTYLALAQVYAANGAVEQSWDMYDALRAGEMLNRQGGHIKDLKINHIEAQIRRNASGYFLEN